MDNPGGLARPCEQALRTGVAGRFRADKSHKVGESARNLRTIEIYKKFRADSLNWTYEEINESYSQSAKDGGA